MTTLNIQNVPDSMMRSIRLAAVNQDKTIREVVINTLMIALQSTDPVLSSPTTITTTRPTPPMQSVSEEEDNPFPPEPQYDHSEEFAQPLSARTQAAELKRKAIIANKMK